MDAKDVISRMLTKDPKARASIKELLAHPWFQTCAGTLTPAGLPCSPHGSVTLAPHAASAVAAELRQGAAVALDPALSQRIQKGSISKAVQQAIKRGKQVKAVPDAVVARLQQFTAMNAFKRQARRVLATYLPEEEVVGLMQVFRSMDRDGDGLLTVRELQAGLAERGIGISDSNAKVRVAMRLAWACHAGERVPMCAGATVGVPRRRGCLPRPAQLMLQRADLDGDGAIDYAEFLAATLHLARLERDERLYRAFRYFDKDGSGFITRDELEAGLQHLGRINVDRILSEADKDGDGRICYTEFCDMLRHDPDPYISVFADNPLESTPSWGAWGEATGSGRLLLAVPNDSMAPSRNVSIANSRQPSGNERTSYASMGAVSIRRSLGGNLLFGSRNARASGTGAAAHPARPSQMGGRPSYAGTARPSFAGSSRFGSMRNAAMLAVNANPSEYSGRSSARTIGSTESAGSFYPLVTHRSTVSPNSGNYGMHAGSTSGPTPTLSAGAVLGMGAPQGPMSAPHAGTSHAAAHALAQRLHHEMLEVVTEVEGSVSSSAFGGATRTPASTDQMGVAAAGTPGGHHTPESPASARRPAPQPHGSIRSVTEGGISDNPVPLPSPFSLTRGHARPQPPGATPTAWGEDPHAGHHAPRPSPRHGQHTSQQPPGAARGGSRDNMAGQGDGSQHSSSHSAHQRAIDAADAAQQARKHAAAVRFYTRTSQPQPEASGGSGSGHGAGAGAHHGSPADHHGHAHHGAPRQHAVAHQNASRVAGAVRTSAPPAKASPGASTPTTPPGDDALWRQIKAMGSGGSKQQPDGTVSLTELMDRAAAAAAAGGGGSALPSPHSPAVPVKPADGAKGASAQAADGGTARRVQSESPSKPPRQPPSQQHQG